MNAEQRSELIALFEDHAKSIGAVRDWCNTLEATLNTIKARVFSDAVDDVDARVLFASPVTGQIETGANVWGLDWFDASPYGKPYGDKRHIHTGADLNLPGYKDAGAMVYAVADGPVVFAGTVKDWQGHVVIQRVDLEDGTSVWVRYAHIETPPHLTVMDNVELKRGELVGYIADYGKVGKEQDHLHYDIAKIDLTNIPGDWPGTSLVHVHLRYHDPAKWHRERSK